MFVNTIVVLVTESRQTFFPKRPQGVPIFIRPNNVDVYNGHAKPKQNNKAVVTLISLPNITSTQSETSQIMTEKKTPNYPKYKIPNKSVTRPPSLVNKKYFVTWRPDLAETNNVIITVRTKHKSSSSSHNKYRPQHFFSQIAHSQPTSTLQPFLLETAISLQKPTKKPRPTTTPTWSYKPIFNPIFEGTTSPKYVVTQKIPAATITTRYSAIHQFSAAITSTTLPPITKTTTEKLTSFSLGTKPTKTSFSTLPPLSISTESLSKPLITKFSSNQSSLAVEETYFQSDNVHNTAQEVEDTIMNSPFTFLAYIRYVFATLFRSNLVQNSFLCAYRSKIKLFMFAEFLLRCFIWMWKTIQKL